MQDQPTAQAMLVSIAALLRDEILPRLDGRPAFQTRVAANALDIVARELERAPDANRAELESLRAILGKDGDLEALNWDLCRAIADGTMTLDTTGLAEHLWRTTMDKLAIDQPGYASYRRAVAERAMTDPQEPTEERA